MTLTFNDNPISDLTYNGNSVNILTKDGVTVWCRPFTYTTGTLPSGVSSLTMTRSATQEPTASTGVISSGGTVYFNDSTYFSATAATGYDISYTHSSSSDPYSVTGTTNGVSACSLSATQKSYNVTKVTQSNGTLTVSSTGKYATNLYFYWSADSEVGIQKTFNKFMLGTTSTSSTATTASDLAYVTSGTSKAFKMSSTGSYYSNVYARLYYTTSTLTSISAPTTASCKGFTKLGNSATITISNIDNPNNAPMNIYVQWCYGTYNGTYTLDNVIGPNETLSTTTSIIAVTISSFAPADQYVYVKLVGATVGGTTYSSTWSHAYDRGGVN